ncbi:MAG: YggS family pyridoxal phosphate-dependent enzyme [Thermodesulfovibrionales bacterium]|nr:YggS family pyridoxal phosphate-dependent enzyme [Thermodesulfovibrionales bacterium]
MNSFIERVSSVYKRICHAAMRAGRSPEEIKLIAVTKTVPVEKILEAVEAGLRIFGENRVQEARDKIPVIMNKCEGLKISWHMIGTLQKNKAKYAVKLFDMIHSVDSEELALEINRQAEKISKIQDILIEVKLSPEETKHGIKPEKLFKLLDFISSLKNLNIKGLMTVPPYSENPEDSRPYFRKLRNLLEEANIRGFNIKELSMGMSGDFEIAIEEGATMVRIGTAIFGERKQ